MTWVSCMDETSTDPGVLLMSTPQQHKRLTTIQPAFQRSQTTGGSIDPDTALRLQGGNPEHISLHRGDTNIEESVLQRLAVVMTNEGSSAAAVIAAIAPARVTLPLTLHSSQQNKRCVNLIPVLNQMR